MSSGASPNKEASLSPAGVSRAVSRDAGGKTPRSLAALVRAGGLIGAIVLGPQSASSFGDADPRLPEPRYRNFDVHFVA